MACSGALSFEVCASAMGEVLKAAFGTVTTTLVASSAEAAVYEHTFTRCDSTSLPSLTVEQNLGGLSSRQVAGVRVNALTLSVSPGRCLVADVDCRGRERAFVTPTSASYGGDEPLHHNGFRAEVGGADSAEVEEALIRFHNNLVDNVWGAGGGGKLTGLPAGAFAVGGRMTMALESTDAEQMFVNGEPTSLRFHAAGATLVGTWGYGLEIDLPRVRYFSARAPLTPGRLVYDITFEALLDEGRQPPAEVICRLWNTRPGY